MWYNSYATVHFVMPTWHSGSIGLEPGAIAWSDSLERQQVRAQQTKGAHCNSRDNRLPWIFSYVYIFIFTDGRHPIYIYCMIQNMNMILWCEYHRIHVHVGSSTSSIPGSCRLWDFVIQQQVDATGDSKANSLAQGVTHAMQTLMRWMPWSKHCFCSIRRDGHQSTDNGI